MLSFLWEVISADWLWFPEGHGWHELTDGGGKVFPHFQDLWVTIPIALCFTFTRRIFENNVATTLGSLMGVSSKDRAAAPPNSTLELHFCQKSKRPSHRSLVELSSQTGCPPQQIQKWYKRRRNQERPSKIKKFKEACWRFTFYLLSFSGGLAVLIDKPWFYDTKKVWEDFPKMPLLSSQYWYYTIELGFYVSLLFSLASDVKRKDFKEQIVHHVATIVLISFSWLVNYIRAGTLIMLVHDTSDYFMEAAKMFNYAGWKRTCNFFFTMFAAVFIITRLILFPFWIIHSTMVYPLSHFSPFFGYFFFNGLLLVLLALHVFWTVLILRMIIKFLPGNEIVEDARSDKEETESETEEEYERRLKPPTSHLLNSLFYTNNHIAKTD